MQRIEKGKPSKKREKKEKNWTKIEEIEKLI
jgi:hypothetical protein